jgi:hypothetical protein
MISYIVVVNTSDPFWRDAVQNRAVLIWAICTTLLFLSGAIVGEGRVRIFLGIGAGDIGLGLSCSTCTGAGLGFGTVSGPVFEISQVQGGSLSVVNSWLAVLITSP